MKSRKAEMSTELLIGLIIVIIVVGIVLFLWAGKYKFFQNNTGCASQGGECVNASNENDKCAARRIFSGSCPTEGFSCCLKRT